jgi:hypothetical protein
LLNRRLVAASQPVVERRRQNLAKTSEPANHQNAA